MSTKKSTTKPKRPQAKETTIKENQTPETLVNRIVKIKPTASHFVGGNGIPEWIRDTNVFISRVNPNGTATLSYVNSLIEIDTLFVDDLEILDEVRTHHDEVTECPKVSIRIFGVPERIECIRENQKRLGIPDELIFIDEKHEGCIPTAKRAWSYPTDKEFVMVLQDDIELCDNFLKYVNTIIDVHPDKIISLFCLNLSKRLSINKIPTVSPYVSVKDTSGQAIILRTEQVQPCLDSWKDELKGDDVNITAWANQNNILILTTLPMTVQHLGIKSVFDPSRSLGLSEFYDKNPVNAAWDNGFVTPWNNIIR